MENLKGKTILITGSARRLGKEIAISCAENGASIILHNSSSDEEAQTTADIIRKIGSEVTVVKSDFSSPKSAVKDFQQVLEDKKDLFALVNNAAVFMPGDFLHTTLEDWNSNLKINLTMPFLLSQAFAEALGDRKGRIINILDWRALRPGKDHFAYTISKAALASMTKSKALALAPNISVNGLALGAILPPSDGGDSGAIIKPVPAARWAEIKEVTDTINFLLTGPDYITGEIIHIDGGRHLV